jgi:hypothetical protein
VPILRSLAFGCRKLDGCLGLASILLMAAATAAHALDGAFDSSFASTGRTTLSLSSSQNDAASQVRETADGKLVLVGSCNGYGCIARLRSDGTPDPTFPVRKMASES